MCDPLSAFLNPEGVLEGVFNKEKEDGRLLRMVNRSGIPSNHHDGIMSDTWEAATKGIHTVRYNSEEDCIITAYRWVCGICKNKINDRRRFLKREREIKEKIAPVMYESAERQSDFLEEIYDILEGALQLLEPKYRMLIEEVHLKKRSYKELEGELGGTVDQLKARCYYARKKLSEKMIQLARKRLWLIPEWDEERRVALRSLIGE